MIEILPVRGIGEVTPGADLAALISGAAPWLRDGDILVVTSKVVAKAEGRLVELPPPGPERDRVREETLAAETARTVAARGATRIVATQHGFVMAAAGIDNSNVDSSRLVLLPKDPDASARSLREVFAHRYGRRVAVVISDTMGRPWRNGLTDVALGSAGIAPLRDYRGETDQYGNELHLTQVAVVDELAAAADLVKGKTDGVPVAVIRGYQPGGPGGAAAGGTADPALAAAAAPGVITTLVRDPETDMFRLGTAEAYADGLREAATLPDARPVATEPAGPVDMATVTRAVATVAPLVASRLVPGDPPDRIRCTAPDPGDPGALVRLGGDVHRLRAALAAAGIRSAPEYPEPGTVLLTLGR